MRIAVALDADGAISRHFRGTTAFAVCEPIAGGMQLVATRLAPAHSHDAGNAHHSHGDVATILGDCCALIVGGMGGRAAQDLLRSGIEPVVTIDFELSPLDASLRFMSGRLERGTTHACCCEH